MRSLFILVVGASIGVCREAVACSPLPPMPYRRPGEVAFIGMATADTTRAGAGSTTFSETERGSVPSRAPIFSQVIRIETLAGSSRAALAMRAHGVEAVLVPWGVSSDCSPVRWHASAQWVPPQTRGFYSGVLRPRSQWVNGRPTIDVSNPWMVPLTGVAPERGPRDTVPALTPDEMLHLYDALPLARSGGESEGVAPLLRWARDNPALAHRAPASDILTMARYRLQQARISRIRSPLAGTYRFMLILPKGDSLAFYARTELHGMGGLDTVDPGEKEKYSADGIPLADGYYLLALAAPDPRSLSAAAQRKYGGENQGYLGFVETPLVASRDSTVWRGSVELVGALAHVIGDVRWRAALDSVQRAMNDEVLAGRLSFAPGHFVSRPNGQVRYESTIMRHGEVLMRLHGERISTTLLTSRH